MMWTSLLFISSVLAIPEAIAVAAGVEGVKVQDCACPIIRPRCAPVSDSECPVDACTDSTTGEWVDCCCDYTLLNDLDFYYRYPKIGEDWAYYQKGDYVADGGYMTFGRRGGLLNTSRYNVSIAQSPFPYLDNYKFLVFADEPVALNQVNDLVVEWQVDGARTFKTDGSPYPPALLKCPGDDVRLASASFNVWDPATDLYFNFLLTNDMVYAVYGRNPDQQTQDYNFAAFNFIVPLLWRKPSDKHSLKVVLSARQRTVRWKIGNKDYFKVDAVGARVDRQFMTVDFGGADDLVFPASIKYGFGSMTLLNHYPACWKACENKPCIFPAADPQALYKTGTAQAPAQWDPKKAKPVPAVFWNSCNPAEEFRLWGQGSVTYFKRLTVYEQKCKSRNIHHYKTVTVTSILTTGSIPTPPPPFTTV